MTTENTHAHGRRAQCLTSLATDECQRVAPWTIEKEKKGLAGSTAREPEEETNSAEDEVSRHTCPTRQRRSPIDSWPELNEDSYVDVTQKRRCAREELARLEARLAARLATPSGGGIAEDHAQHEQFEAAAQTAHAEAAQARQEAAQAMVAQQAGQKKTTAVMEMLSTPHKADAMPRAATREGRQQTSEGLGKPQGGVRHVDRQDREMHSQRVRRRE